MAPSTVPPPNASLAEVAAYMAAPGKGILASDESTGTIGKRLEKVGISNDEVSVLVLFNRAVSVTAKLHLQNRLTNSVLYQYL